jgi:hypothetical protein
MPGTRWISVGVHFVESMILMTFSLCSTLIGSGLCPSSSGTVYKRVLLILYLGSLIYMIWIEALASTTSVGGLRYCWMSMC